MGTLIEPIPESREGLLSANINNGQHDLTLGKVKLRYTQIGSDSSCVAISELALLIPSNEARLAYIRRPNDDSLVEFYSQICPTQPLVRNSLTCASRILVLTLHHCGICFKQTFLDDMTRGVIYD